MKKSMLAASLLAALTWTPGAFAQSPVVNVTLVNGQIQVDPDPVNVERQMGRNVPIRWQIDPRADFSFDPTAIRVEGEQTSRGLRPQDQLPRECNGGPKHVTCVNRNSRPGQFKYTVRLRDRNQALIERDPIIINR
jgi:hypothetical protein